MFNYPPCDSQRESACMDHARLASGTACVDCPPFPREYVHDFLFVRLYCLLSSVNKGFSRVWYGPKLAGVQIRELPDSGFGTSYRKAVGNLPNTLLPVEEAH